MATLHSITELTKKAIKWIGISLASFLVLFLLLQMLLFVKNVFFPKNPPPPTVSFGALPPLVFPESVKTHKPTYSLETVSGNLPILPSTAKVHTIVLDSPNLLALEKAREKVGHVGFNDAEKKLSDTEYTWESATDSLQKNIIMSTLTFNFHMTSNYTTYPPLQSLGSILSEESAKDDAQSFFDSIDAFPADFDDTQTRTELLTLKQGTFFPATSLSNANVVRVDFYQKNWDSLPIYYPNPPGSTINALMAPDGEILEANFFHQTISEKGATYPLKTVSEAFEELKKGDAYIGHDTTEAEEIKITDAFLAYYLGDTQQEYMIPIIVFKSTGDSFYAYVSAVRSEWIQKPKTTEQSK